uniref:Cytochrome c oxidase subunit 8 n=1 Tax=Loxodonta africana TaxID=9785 RepID=G3U5G5_LOXAF
MLRLLPTARLLQAPLRSQVAPRAPISAKPARTPTSAKEQAVGLISFFCIFLLPAGWILSHLDHYKKSSFE